MAMRKLARTKKRKFFYRRKEEVRRAVINRVLPVRFRYRGGH